MCDFPDPVLTHEISCSCSSYFLPHPTREKGMSEQLGGFWTARQGQPATSAPCAEYKHMFDAVLQLGS